MLPYGAEHNLRLIIPNLRDYPRSTAYTQEELDELRGPSPELQEKALQARAIEFAAFLKWVIESDVSIKGISVVAWSAGNCQALAFLANARILSKETRELLGKHLRSFVMYGA